jgi:hypothetical protein
MKLGVATRLTSKKGLPILLSVSFFLWSANTPLFLGQAGSWRSVVFSQEVQPARAVLWHAGNFRVLEDMSGDLVTFVQGLEHPNNGGYGKLSTTRQANFNLFLDALFTAIEASLADGATGDWCRVKTQASAAGYATARFYDTDSGRWFVYAYDTTPFGQAYFFINPFAKRNIVIEVPHEGFEFGTKTQGARLFKALAARALLINKEHRCSDRNPSPCTGKTTVCDDSPCSGEPTDCRGHFRESDVAHHTANTFHLLHLRYTDMDPVTKFVQLHGFKATAGDMAEIGDGTTRDEAPDSVSVLFANSLGKYVPIAEDVHSCQQSVGDPPSDLCGESNVQGRYTNNPGSDACHTFTSEYSARFLHLEQGEPLRDDDDSDGWDWGDIRDALLDTWPDCNMNNGATDCRLGPRQTQYPTLICP